MLRRRHRTGPYPPAQTRSPVRALIPLAAAAVALFILLWAGKALLSTLQFGNAVQRTAVVLRGDDRGSVSVSLNGEDPRVSDSELKLYPGDSVATDRGAAATLELFDGSIIRIDRGSALTIEESVLGAKESAFALAMERGSAWIRTPESVAFAGTVLRTIETATYTAQIPSGAEVYLTEAAIEVYAADGVGVTFRVPDIDEDLIAGEGQKFTIPTEDATLEEAYAGRSALSSDFAASAFVAESRTVIVVRTSGDARPAPRSDSLETLTVTSPVDGATITSATVDVTGAYATTVDTVRVNGYRAQMDMEKRTYAIEISLPDAESIPVTVEALDKNGLVLEKELLTLKRDRTPPGKPGIIAPAADGATFKTNNEELEIRGSAPRGTAGIIVNDYRLQLFETGDTEWSYLASTKLNNFTQGENIYRIVAVSEAGFRSDPAVLTIILGQGDEGVISAGSSSAGTSTSTGALPNNAPTKPGTLTITAPSAGLEHQATLSGTGAEFLIEGNVPSGTASVWVNDYKLQLYTAGKTFFNYIASTGLNTLKRGSNTYEIIIRDTEGKILDRVTYTIILSVQ